MEWRRTEEAGTELAEMCSANGQGPDTAGRNRGAEGAYRAKGICLVVHPYLWYNGNKENIPNALLI
jgi:hypothetical protein